jgi:hypothetical protein
MGEIFCALLYHINFIFLFYNTYTFRDDVFENIIIYIADTNIPNVDVYILCYTSYTRSYKK